MTDDTERESRQMLTPEEMAELAEYFDTTDLTAEVEASTLDPSTLDLECGGYVSFNMADTEVTVWCNSQGFGPPGPPISNYQVTVWIGNIELPGYADIPWTGDNEYDEAQCLIGAQAMLDHLRAALVTARIPKKVRRC